MKVYRIILYAVLATFFFQSTSHAISEEKREEYEKTTWRLHLKLDMPELVAAAVIWAVFEEDPIPEYRQRIEKVKDIYRKFLEEKTDEKSRQIAKNAQMQVSWNLGFKKITGDEVCLLTEAPGVSHSLASNSEAGKKWIVTKVVYIKRKLICWVIPVETEVGKTVDVVLSNENVFNLAEIYDEIMSEESQR